MKFLPFVWGIGGVIALLAFALYRLTPHAVDMFDHELGLWHYVGLIASCAFMAYSEGYKGFQKGFSPRVVARARHLMTDQAKPHWKWLAPMFCMSYFAAPRKRKIVVGVLTTFIVLCVILIRFVPQPWRGILDAGVVVGLSWGIISILCFCWQAAKGKLEQSPELE